MNIAPDDFAPGLVVILKQGLLHTDLISGVDGIITHTRDVHEALLGWSFVVRSVNLPMIAVQAGTSPNLYLMDVSKTKWMKANEDWLAAIYGPNWKTVLRATPEDCAATEEMLRAQLDKEASVVPPGLNTNGEDDSNVKI